jgi:nucleotide-binding universal stress UspA family protein
MEKILLALDAQNLNMNSIDFGCYLARLTHSRLTGVFLENLLYGETAFNSLMVGIPYPPDSPVTMLDPSPLKTPTEENIRLFKEACTCRGISPLIHRDRGVPAKEIVEESRFADLIVVDAETSFTRGNESLPGRFVKDILLEAECPVIISPYSFESIDQVFFTYNGTRSCVFAIKQFAYLFPELNQKKATIVNVRAAGEHAIEEPFKMKEWLKNHFNEVEFVVLTGDPADELFGYLLEKKNCFVVMGAYGRGMISRFFKPSHARLIVKTVNLPIFIAHH